MRPDGKTCLIYTRLAPMAYAEKWDEPFGESEGTRSLFALSARVYTAFFAIHLKLLGVLQQLRDP